MKKRKFLFTGVLKIGVLKDFLNSLVKVHKLLFSYYQCSVIKGGSRAAATSKMECFVIIDYPRLSQSTPSWMLQKP